MWNRTSVLLTYLYLYLYIDPTSLFSYIYLIISRTALILSYILLRLLMWYTELEKPKLKLYHKTQGSCVMLNVEPHYPLI